MLPGLDDRKTDDAARLAPGFRPAVEGEREMDAEGAVPDRRWDGRDACAALGLGIGFLILYLRTLCPTVYLGDAGEICTAIATGGIIHPPGYPLFSLLGRAALVLIPYGEPAFRIGCVVALAAAAAVAALCGLAREIGASRWAAAAAAAAFGASHTFWAQSTRVEVYSLHTLLACLLLWAALCYRRSGSLAHLTAAGLVGSLGLAHHLTMVLLGPGLLLLCGRRFFTGPGRGRRFLVLGVVLSVGPALYLLLMHWARAEPLQDWGRPVTLALLWDHASARFYHGSLHLPNGPRILQRLAGAGALFVDDFPAMAFLMPFLGAWTLWRRDRVVVAGLLLAALGVILFNLCYQIDDITAYYLAAWIVAAALTAVALDALWARARRPGSQAVLAIAVCSWLFVLPLARNWRGCDLSSAIWVREFTRQKLECTDPGGVLISAGDDDTFPLWYVHDLLKVRPDVTQVDRRMASGMWSRRDADPSLWYLYRLRCQGVNAPVTVPREFARRAYLGSDGYLIDLLNGPLRGRPLCATFFNSHDPMEKDARVFFRWAAARYQILPLGLVLRLQPIRRPVDLKALIAENERQWTRITQPDLRGVRTDGELASDYILNHYTCSLINFGGLYELAGDRARAGALYRRAAAWAPGYKPAAAALAPLQRQPTAG